MRKENAGDAVNGFGAAVFVLGAMMFFGIADHIGVDYLKTVSWIAPVFAFVLILATANETMKRPSRRNENAALLGVFGIVLSLSLWAMMYMRLDALSS